MLTQWSASGDLVVVNEVDVWCVVSFRWHIRDIVGVHVEAVIHPALAVDTERRQCLAYNVGYMYNAVVT